MDGWFPRFDRRVFLKGGGLALVSFAAGSLGGGPRFLHRTALAATGEQPFRRRKVLVALFQRGAMDAMSAVPSLDDGRLRRLRPQLALSAARSAGEAGLIDLDGRFGLHPSLRPFEELYREGRLAVVHAVGSPDPTRSHFDAQDFMEAGTPGRRSASGWLNRASGMLGHEASPFRSVALSGSLPKSFYGEHPVLAVRQLRDLAVELPGARRSSQAATRGFEALYAEASEELLRGTAADAFDAIELLREAGLRGDRPAPGAVYPRSPLGGALRQVAFLVKSNLGLEVAFVESGGWDTHVRQGADRGTFADRAADLAGAVTAFWTDLGSYQDDVALLTMTEFGRTVAENGSGGTDHGHGSCLFVLGNAVDGGKVHGELPGLRPEDLYQGRDLPVTTDFRSVFAEVAGRHL